MQRAHGSKRQRNIKPFKKLLHFNPAKKRIDLEAESLLSAASMALEPKILELSNGRITARIANLGATITSLLVPDAHGSHRSLFSLFRIQWILWFPANPFCWLKSAQGESRMWCSDSMTWTPTWWEKHQSLLSILVCSPGVVSFDFWRLEWAELMFPS